MKSIAAALLIIMALLVPGIVKSQDTLILANGTKVASKISEISSTEIKYKRLDNPDGPVFIANKSEVAVIKYQNGTSDTLMMVKPKAAVKTPNVIVDKQQIPTAVPAITEVPELRLRGSKYMFGNKRISENQMYRKILSLNDPQLTKYVKKAKVAKTLQFIGIAAAPAIACGVGDMIITRISDIHNWGEDKKSDYTSAIPFFAIGAACLTTSVIFKIQYKHTNAKIVKLYNEKY